jgi:hypothetical protein
MMCSFHDVLLAAGKSDYAFQPGGAGIRTLTALRIRLQPATSCPALGQQVDVFIEELVPSCPLQEVQ